MLYFLLFSLAFAQWHIQEMVYTNETLLLNPPESCYTPSFGPFYGTLASDMRYIPNGEFSGIDWIECGTIDRIIEITVARHYSEMTQKRAMMSCGELCILEGFVPAVFNEDIQAIRYRSYGNSGGHEFFAGIASLGSGPPRRVQQQFVWSSPNAYSMAMEWNVQNETILRLDDEELVYSDTAAQAATFGKTYSPFEVNALSISVAARDDGTLIRLQNMTLNGVPLNFDFEAMDPMGPASGMFNLWTLIGLPDIGPNGYVLNGTMVIEGVFSSSQERNRVDISAGVNEDCLGFSTTSTTQSTSSTSITSTTQTTDTTSTTSTTQSTLWTTTAISSSHTRTILLAVLVPTVVIILLLGCCCCCCLVKSRRRRRRFFRDNANFHIPLNAF